MTGILLYRFSVESTENGYRKCHDRRSERAVSLGLEEIHRDKSIRGSAFMIAKCSPANLLSSSFCRRQRLTIRRAVRSEGCVVE